MFLRLTAAAYSAASLCLGVMAAGIASAESPSGGFMAILNTQRNNGDSPETVLFYDADDLATGSASPLFGVHVPFEQITVLPDGGVGGNSDEPAGLTVDPATGDLYFVSFDSGSAPVIDNSGNGTGPDTDADLDLYKINFQTVYQHWATNFRGKVIGTTPGVPAVGGVAPTIPLGAPAGGFDDFVIYGSNGLFGDDDHLGDDANRHANTFFLPGSLEKIGEVGRNTGQGFFDYRLEFVNEDKLLLLDDSTEPDLNETAASDHAFREVVRVSTSPGAANGIGDPEDPLNSIGYNSSTTESWESKIIGRVNLDFGVPPAVDNDFNNNGVVDAADYTLWRDGATLANDTVTPGTNTPADYPAWVSDFGTFGPGPDPQGHSEPDDIAVVNADGVSGFWVLESDSTGTMATFPNLRGDTVAFYDFATDSYRPFVSSGPGPAPTRFTLDNDPMMSGTANDGRGDLIFVDADTGDLIIVEVGFDDDVIATIGAEHEPSVLRREIVSYDNNGAIELGGWSEKRILGALGEQLKEDSGEIFDDGGTPLDPMDDDFYFESGFRAAYDSVNDLMYFWDPGRAASDDFPNYQEYSFGPDGIDNGGPGAPGSDDILTDFLVDIFVLDINTGVTTVIRNVDDSYGFDGDLTEFFFLTPPASLAVPEPTSALLVACALAGFAGRRRG